MRARVWQVEEMGRAPDFGPLSWKSTMQNGELLYPGGVK